jgi:hypothetical protein
MCLHRIGHDYRKDKNHSSDFQRFPFLNLPQRKSGGMAQQRVYIQMKIRVTSEETGVDRGNCRS